MESWGGHNSIARLKEKQRKQRAAQSKQSPEEREEDRKNREAERLEQECSERKNRIILFLNAHITTDPIAKKCFHDCSEVFATKNYTFIDNLLDRVAAFVASKELKELAGPVPPEMGFKPQLSLNSSMPDLEDFSWYLHRFPFEELGSNSKASLKTTGILCLRGLKLGFLIIQTREDQWRRHRLEPHKYYLDLIDSAYAHLKIRP
jgi:hypothetical protein